MNCKFCYFYAQFGWIDVETILVDKFDAVHLCENMDENATLPYSELEF